MLIMSFVKLTYRGKEYYKNSEILDILKSKEFYWLIDSEIINADIEIINDTIIWNSGDYLYGDWYYGIFKDGNFSGNWENGIFEGGTFSGKWESGINFKN
jgi:hypothetical protein